MGQARKTEASGLVGDVGGTNARFAIAEVSTSGIRIRNAKVLQAADFTTAGEALIAYLDGLKSADRPRQAVIAAAGPVKNGAVSFTNNHRWRFSETDLTKSAGLARVHLINDFAAQALALPHLKPRMLHTVGERGRSIAKSDMVVMGPGTGFGVAALAQGDQGLVTVSGEGGHIGFAPQGELEAEILARLARRFGHVSIERVLSGPGLLNLYQSLGDIEDAPAPLAAPADVTKAALAGETLARRALECFCGILGSVAGDFALTFGARKGVFISGGIAPDILNVLDASDFRRRFEDKGRMSDYLRPIPTRVVLEPHAALIGAATLLGTQHS